jgi:hypothetical protein
MAPSLRQKTPVTMCAKCRQMFNPGDRVTTAYIVQKIGRNPESREMGALLGEDFELVHVSCVDHGLEGRLIVPT